MNFCAYAPPRTGKSVFALGMIQEYLHQGRHIVCNFPLNYDAVQSTYGKKYKSAKITICSPRPEPSELFSLGAGYHDDHPDVEEMGGLLVIDEAGTWINSRTWNDKHRSEITRWFTLSGKLGWDVLLLVQDPNLLDKQIRDAGIEIFGRVMRTDRVRVPILGIKLPRVHIATFRYGMDANAIKCFSKMYRGNGIYKYFDTHFMFDDFAPFSFFRPLVNLTKAQIARFKISAQKKHVLTQRIMKLPVERRVEFFRRFEAVGAFDRV